MRIGPAFGYDVGKINAGCLIQKIVNASAVLAGLPSHLLNRLQSVLNAAARLVCRARKYDHVTHLFRDLHWLRVPERLQFRLAVLAFCCRNQKAPSYLADELHWTDHGPLYYHRGPWTDAPSLYFFGSVCVYT